MCGIAGWVDFERDLERERDVAQAMTDTMRPRGPDAGGLWISRHAALGHRRTSVIDLAGGIQPMVADDEHGEPLAVVTFSGEIYNFQSLRAELESRGHRFATRSDTEVLLRSYLEWGADCGARLEGMFGFGVWDVRREELVLVRDRIGIKPLYYAPHGDGVLFGSEPKAILAHPEIRARVDIEGLREAFSMAKTPGSSPFRGIYEVLPGHCMTVSRRGRHATRYWQLEARPHTDDLDTTVRTVRSMVEGSIARELVSDVPLCSMLSGGIDSSTVTAIAARVLDEQGLGPIRTTTATFVGYSENFRPDNVRSAPDAPYAAELARHVGADHTDIVLGSADLMDPQARLGALLAQDLPTAFGDMDTSALLMFRAVREHSTVALTGETADEIFGGFNWMHLPDLVYADTFPWVAYEQWHPATATGLGRKLLSPQLTDKLDMQGFYADRYRQALAEVPHLDGESEEEHRMREVCHLHLTRWLPKLLDRDDRLAMAVGLEARVPFCDHRLVEYVFNVTWEMKTFDGREKSLLRAATADLLPQSVLERPKSPFPVSQDPAYSDALHAELAEVLADPDAPVLPLLDLEAATEASQHPQGQVREWLDRMNIEMVLQLNAWLRHYDVELAL